MNDTHHSHAEHPGQWPVVQLVGAGPGDPELLTLKALKAIQSATLILVDDLVSPEICALIPKTCRQIFVGKRGGCQSTPQAFIEKLMIQGAKDGERVVRLKGGDPCIFGRAGEEIETLHAHQVQAQVINGVTSGLAAMSSLNLPLTHRQYAHGVVFVTGHAKEGQSGVNWMELGRVAQSSKLTLIVYMGVSLIENIQKGLIQGLSGQTPVAVIERASTKAQRHLITSLEHLMNDIKVQSFKSPSVVVIGDVIKGLRALEQAPPMQSLKSQNNALMHKGF